MNHGGTPRTCALAAVHRSPHFDNVQYAELMDFCYVWLRQLLSGEDPAFAGPSTRHARELTGNTTLGRGVIEFTGFWTRA